MDSLIHHRLKVVADVGVVRLRVRVEFGAAWTVIFGPSGSGKSSLLRAMCGLLDGAEVESETGGIVRDGGGVRVAPHLRGIAYAPQGAVLFPHLTVRENVAFAGRFRGDGAFKFVDEALELFELKALAERMPQELSGGERQRVSLARAFAVPQARLMLLDEPFTGIGRAQRDVLLVRMRAVIVERGVPVISVTHDVEEAFLLAAEVVRLEAGAVVAQGPAEVVLAEERREMLRALRR